MACDGAHEDRERIADIEGAGRAVNEQIVEQWGELVVDGHALFRCECGFDTCTAAVWLPVGRYERVRADPMTFLIQLGHELSVAEDVIERGDGYAVVRKHEDLRHLAEASDPRRR